MARPFNALRTRMEKLAAYQGLEHELENDYPGSPLRESLMARGRTGRGVANTLVGGFLGAGLGGMLGHGLSGGSTGGTVAGGALGAGLGAAGFHALGRHGEDELSRDAIDEYRQAYRSVKSHPDTPRNFNLEEDIQRGNQSLLRAELRNRMAQTAAPAGMWTGAVLGGYLGHLPGYVANSTAGTIGGGLAGAAVGGALGHHFGPHFVDSGTDDAMQLLEDAHRHASGRGR